MKPKRKTPQPKARSGNGETHLTDSEIAGMIAARAGERAAHRGLGEGWEGGDSGAASAEMLHAAVAAGQDIARAAGNGQDLKAESTAFLEAEEEEPARAREDGDGSVEDPLHDWPDRE